MKKAVLIADLTSAAIVRTVDFQPKRVLKTIYKGLEKSKLKVQKRLKIQNKKIFFEKCTSTSLYVPYLTFGVSYSFLCRISN